MYFANWILNYLPKPISRVYLQLGTCRPGIIKKAVTNIFYAKLFNPVYLDSWKQCKLIFRLDIFFFQGVGYQHSALCCSVPLESTAHTICGWANSPLRSRGLHFSVVWGSFGTLIFLTSSETMVLVEIIAISVNSTFIKQDELSHSFC